MSNVAATNAAAAYHAMVLNAVRSWGPIVKVESDEFQDILRRSMEIEPNPLVLVAEGGWFSTVYSYLTPYKGLYFYTNSSYPLSLPQQVEIIKTKKIWIPNT